MILVPAIEIQINIMVFATEIDRLGISIFSVSMNIDCTHADTLRGFQIIQMGS